MLSLTLSRARSHPYTRYSHPLSSSFVHRGRLRTRSLCYMRARYLWNDVIDEIHKDESGGGNAISRFSQALFGSGLPIQIPYTSHSNRSTLRYLYPSPSLLSANDNSFVSCPVRNCSDRNSPLSPTNHVSLLFAKFNYACTLLYCLI